MFEDIFNFFASLCLAVASPFFGFLLTWVVFCDNEGFDGEQVGLTFDRLFTWVDETGGLSFGSVVQFVEFDSSLMIEDLDSFGFFLL